MTDVESLCLEVGALEIRAELVRRAYDRDARAERRLSLAILAARVELMEATEKLREALNTVTYRGEPCPCEECSAAT